MTNLSVVLEATEVPDLTCPRLRATVGGPVRDTVWQWFADLLRSIASMPPASLLVTLYLVYVPNKPAQAPQSRLRIFLQVGGDKLSVQRTVALIRDGNPLSRFVGLEEVDAVSAPWEQLASVFELVRRIAAVGPGCPLELNDRVPAAYITADALMANPQNDYSPLDRTLSRLSVPAVVRIDVGPTDVESVRQALGRQLSRLADINKPVDLSWDTIRWSEQSADHNAHGRVRPLLPLRRRDSLADDIRARHSRIHDGLFGPSCAFRVRAMSVDDQVAYLLATVLADTAFSGAGHMIVPCGVTTVPTSIDLQLAEISKPEMPLPIEFSTSQAQAWYLELAPLHRVATVDELAGLVRLPVAADGSPWSIRAHTDPPLTNSATTIILGNDRDLLSASVGSAGVPCGLEHDALAKHAFVVGGSGSGKTSAMMHILAQLGGRRLDIDGSVASSGLPFTPFCLIEPVKTEYRSLTSLTRHPDPTIREWASRLRVYPLTLDAIPLLRINPLGIMPGIQRDEHIAHLMHCFQGALPMSGPLPALLQEALYEVYRRHPHPDYPPTIFDLVEVVGDVISRKGYTDEVTPNLCSALQVRLEMLTRGSIGRLFRCRRTVPAIADIMNTQSIIELEGLSAEHANLFMLFFLNAVREHFIVSPHGGAGVRFLLGIEEAHLLAGNTGPAVPGEDNPNPGAYATQFLCRMLAEMRGLGVGLCILDQLPSAVAPEVIKNAATKLVFRQLDRQERQTLANTVPCGETDINQLGTAMPGEALFHTEGMYRARWIRTPDVRREWDLRQAPVRDALLSHIAKEAWCIAAAQDRAVAELDQAHRAMNEHDGLRERLVREARRLLRIYQRITKTGPILEDVIHQLDKDVARLRNELTAAHLRFVNDVYRPFITDTPVLEGCAESVLQMRDALVRRYETVIAPDVERMTQALNELLKRLADVQARK